jgi:hypothetical protein
MIAAISLVITMWNTFATRQAAEVSTIFDLWSRYEGYRTALDQVADQPFDVARGPFLDLANFVEHLCYLINNRAVPRVVRRNLQSLVLDYLAITNRRSGTSYEAVLEVFHLSPQTYAETSKFIRRHRSSISQREKEASEVGYGPFKASEAKATCDSFTDRPSLDTPPFESIKMAKSLVQST